MSKERLNDTVRSDELVNTSNVVNQVGSLTSSYENLPQDGGYSQVHHTNLIKTANSFYQRQSNDLDMH